MKSSTLAFLIELVNEEIENTDGEEFGGRTSSGYKSFSEDKEKRILELKEILNELKGSE